MWLAAVKTGGPGEFPGRKSGAAHGHARRRDPRVAHGCALTCERGWSSSRSLPEDPRIELTHSATATFVVHNHAVSMTTLVLERPFRGVLSDRRIYGERP